MLFRMIFILRAVFLFVFIVSILVFFFDFSKSTKNDKKDKTTYKSNNNQFHIIDIIEYLIAIIVLLAIIVFAVLKFSNTKWNKYILVILCITYYLQLMTHAADSIEIIRNVVQSNDSANLSNLEQVSIQTVSLVVMILSVYDIGDKLIESIIHINSEVFSDILLLTVILVIIFIYFFLTSNLLLVPLKKLSSLLIKLDIYFKNKTSLFETGEIIQSWPERIIESKKLFSDKYKRFIDKSSPVKKSLKIVFLFFSPFLFIVDLIKAVFIVLIYVLLSTVKWFVRILGIVKRSFGKIVKWIHNISEHRFMAVAFRISIIASFLVTIIINRYDPIGRRIQESSAVLEIAASAIVIPVIIKWISEVRAKDEKDS